MVQADINTLLFHCFSHDWKTASNFQGFPGQTRTLSSTYNCQRLQLFGLFIECRKTITNWFPHFCFGLRCQTRIIFRMGNGQQVVFRLFRSDLQMKNEWPWGTASKTIAEIRRNRACTLLSQTQKYEMFLNQELVRFAGLRSKLHLTYLVKTTQVKM